MLEDVAAALIHECWSKFEPVVAPALNKAPKAQMMSRGSLRPGRPSWENERVE
jgi:hypothetical protein